MGSFSRAFHKISAAYGWDDEKIKELTIRRMRQISAEIDQAAWIEKYHQRQLTAWQTRMICSWLVKLTPELTPESAKSLMDEAASISLDGAAPAKTSNTQRPVGVPTRRDFYNMSDEEIEQHLGQGDNGDGSFEQLLQGFGRQ